MKKLITALVAITVLFSATASANDLSEMTDVELYALHRDVLDEMTRRGLPEEPEADFDLSEISQRIVTFFLYWSDYNPDGMLTLCDSGWKAGFEDPQAELLRILADRTPLDVTTESIDSIAGEGPENLAYCLAEVVSHLDGNNGTAPEKYLIRLLVRKESDGLWYINPAGIENCEKAEEDIPAEAAPADAAASDTVLYYEPSGGEYYHLDQNCKSVHPKYLPLQGTFLYSELGDKPYCDLKPCKVCGAP